MNVLIKIEKDTGLKPKDIANKLGITNSYYSMIKNNIRPISKEMAIKIHELFKIPLDDIFFNLGVNRRLTKDNQAATGTDS